MQFLVKGHLKNIQRLKIALTLRAREIFGLWKVYSNLTPNFTRNHVSTNLCCYLQAVPYHLRLRTRFHIRFKRHARRVGQVRHLSMKNCVLKTRAKPVPKTFHENFTSSKQRQKWGCSVTMVTIYVMTKKSQNVKNNLIVIFWHHFQRNVISMFVSILVCKLSTCKTDSRFMNFNLWKWFDIQMSFLTLNDGLNTIDKLFGYFCAIVSNRL